MIWHRDKLVFGMCLNAFSVKNCSVSINAIKYCIHVNVCRFILEVLCYSSAIRSSSHPFSQTLFSFGNQILWDLMLASLVLIHITHSSACALLNTSSIGLGRNTCFCFLLSFLLLQPFFAQTRFSWDTSFSLLLAKEKQRRAIL